MSQNTPHIAACLLPLSPDADGAVQLFPSGAFDAPRGALRGKGPWRLDAGAAGQLMGAAALRQNDILIDYEHQSLLCADNGQPVPAAGWIDGASLQWRDDPAAACGLFATRVKWTGNAAARIAADEYRYLSPVFSYEPKTGIVLDIINVALTNNPAIDGMRAVTVAAASRLASNSLTNPQESAMDELPERLCYLLNLPLTSTADDIATELDKLKAMVTRSDGATAGLSALLLAKDGEIAALTARALSAPAEPDPALYAPVAVVTELRTQLAALSATAAGELVAKLVAAGVAAGKIMGESERAWATAFGKKDVGGLRAYLDSAQPIAALAGMQTNGNAPVADGGAALSPASPEEQAVAVQLGVGVDEIIKQRGGL